MHLVKSTWKCVTGKMGRANRDKRGKFVTSVKGGKRVSSRVQNVLRTLLFGRSSSRTKN